MATEDRNSAEAETFRTLRTTVSMLGREKDRRTFLFTSALPGEGKTFASVNYAASLAQQGLRTLLVDMDLRRPMLEEFFTGKRGLLPGVTDYFLGRKKFDELCLQHKDLAKLFWIPGGSSVPNPLELLTQSDFQQLLNEGLAHFDRIVIDTMPLLPVSDALLLAAKVQTVVLVVQGCKTPRKVVQRSVQLLNNANAPVGGIVLNLLPNRLLQRPLLSVSLKRAIWLAPPSIALFCSRSRFAPMPDFGYNRLFALRNWISVMAAFSFFKTGFFAVAQDDIAAKAHSSTNAATNTLAITQNNSTAKTQDDSAAETTLEKRLLELRLGPFDLHPQLAAGLTYDDNILLATVNRKLTRYG